MRYATKAMGETTNLLGKFTAGRTPSQIQIILINIETAALEILNTPNCTEMTASTIGIRSTYKWSTANITTQPTVLTEYHYIMTDTLTGQVQDGKIVLGGHPDQIAISRYESAVHIDTTGAGVALPTPGVFSFPVGTPGVPVDNVSDAYAIAVYLGLRDYHINGAITVTTTHTNWRFAGEEPRQDIVTITSGASVSDSSFERIGIRGDLTGTISASESLIGTTSGTTTGIDGVFTDCGFSGTIKIANGGLFRGLRANFLDLTGTIIDFNSPTISPTQFVAMTAGNFNIRNANARVLIGVVMQGGFLSNEANTFPGPIQYLFGIGERTADDAVYILDADYLVRGSRIDINTSSVSGATWDEILASHTTSGTFGWFTQKLLTVAKFLGLK